MLGNFQVEGSETVVIVLLEYVITHTLGVWECGSVEAVSGAMLDQALVGQQWGCLCFIVTVPNRQGFFRQSHQNTSGLLLNSADKLSTILQSNQVLQSTMSSSFQVAIQKYVDRLSSDERQTCRYASPQDFVAETNLLQTSTIFRSRAHRFIMALEPLVQFLSRYATAVDTLVQYDVNPSAIVWGTLKTLLVVK